MLIQRLLGALLFLAACLPLTVRAAPAAAESELATRIHEAIASHLQQETQNLPGHIEVVPEIPDLTRYSDCDELSITRSGGSRLRSRMSIGVRCLAPTNWTLYVPTQISLIGTYYVTTRTLQPGDAVTADALSPQEGELLGLPDDAVMDPAQAVETSARQRIPAGQPLRLGSLRHADSVLRGQSVRLIVRGSGFVVTGEGQAMADASPGSRVQVRAASGQIVTGVVLDARTVEIPL
ncbi:flagellar basal body P-ring formation chaperone FlgA [Corticimicrobacter populi]|nr:flagellar basal body P-ring formation chaperone FlgA [Corticimicrobacter populi]